MVVQTVHFLSSVRRRSLKASNFSSDSLLTGLPYLRGVGGESFSSRRSSNSLSFSNMLLQCYMSKKICKFAHRGGGSLPPTPQRGKFLPKKKRNLGLFCFPLWLRWCPDDDGGRTDHPSTFSPSGLFCGERERREGRNSSHGSDEDDDDGERREGSGGWGGMGRMRRTLTRLPSSTPFKKKKEEKNLIWENRCGRERRDALCGRSWFLPLISEERQFQSGLPIGMLYSQSCTSGIFQKCVL